MTDEDGTNLIGIGIGIETNDPGGIEKYNFYRAQLGKYNLDEAYNFCLECLIDAFKRKGGEDELDKSKDTN